SRPAVNRGIQPQTPPDRPGRAAGRPGAHRPDPVVDWPGSRGPIAFLPAAGDGAHGAAVRSHRTNLVCRRGHDGLRPTLPPVAPRQVDRLADEAPWTLHAQAKAGEASFFWRARWRAARLWFRLDLFDSSLTVLGRFRCHAAQGTPVQQGFPAGGPSFVPNSVVPRSFVKNLNRRVVRSIMVMPCSSAER